MSWKTFVQTKEDESRKVRSQNRIMRKVIDEKTSSRREKVFRGGKYLIWQEKICWRISYLVPNKKENCSQENKYLVQLREDNEK